MNKILIFKDVLLFLLLSIFINSSLYGISLAATDIDNSVDTEVRVFGSWKTYLLTLKSSKKVVVMEVIFDKNHIFRMTSDRSGNIAYTIIQPNIWKYPHKLEQNGNVLMIIGDNQYIIQSKMMAYHNFVITFLDGMPDNFVDLAKNNKVFMISYNIHVKVAPPILLDGFNSALQYAHQLQKQANYIK